MTAGCRSIPLKSSASWCLSPRTKLGAEVLSGPVRCCRRLVLVGDLGYGAAL